jgi:sodium-dependent dicarboxylate transporter 2/3/5
MGKGVIEKSLAAMGPLSVAEKKVAVVFGSAAFLWIFQDFIRPVVTSPLTSLLGWNFGGKHYEAWVAMGAAGILALAKGLPLSAVKRVPWSTLVLLGGSFAMAQGMEGSGLSSYMAHSLKSLSEWPLFGQLLLSSLGTVGLSAIASNSATINLMLQMLPQSLTVLATSALAASCDFALPAGTPPNAIVFGSGFVRLPTMMRVGALLDVLAAVSLAVYGMAYLSWLLG